MKLSTLLTLNAPYYRRKPRAFAADGKMVTLRTMSELLQARDAIKTDIAAAAPAAQRRPYPRHQLADFSD